MDWPVFINRSVAAVSINECAADIDYMRLEWLALEVSEDAVVGSGSAQSGQISSQPSATAHPCQMNHRVGRKSIQKGKVKALQAASAGIDLL